MESALRHPHRLMWYEDPLRMDNLGALIQETVRAFNHGWYPRLVTTLPHIEDGYVHAPSGLGLELLPEVFDRPDLQLRSTPA